MVNPEVEAGPTTKSRNEENWRRIYITKKMVPEFGATWGCKGCQEIAQPHTEECRARITAMMEQDPANAKRLEENTTKSLELVRQNPGRRGAGRRSDHRAQARTARRRCGSARVRTSQVDLRAARLGTTWKCDRQPVASDRWNQAA